MIGFWISALQVLAGCWVDVGDEWEDGRQAGRWAGVGEVGKE